MKYEKLIHMQIITDTKVHLDVIRVLTEDQKAEVSDILEVSL